MTLVTTVTYTFECEVGEDAFEEWKEDGYTREDCMKNEEKFVYDEVIGRIEGRIDNLCLSNWSRDNVDMKWEE